MDFMYGLTEITLQTTMDLANDWTSMEKNSYSCGKNCKEKSNYELVQYDQYHMQMMKNVWKDYVIRYYSMK